MEENNIHEFDRYQLIKAMEVVVRSIDNESLINRWLSQGVADGDIDMNTLGVNFAEMDNLEYFIQDNEEFSALMTLFLDLMTEAANDGGLYCDGVVSK